MSNDEKYVNILTKGGKTQKREQKKVNCIENSKTRMRGICKSLSYPTVTYDPRITISSIMHYLSDDNKVGRILYSEISNHLFSLEDETRGIFITNIDKLLNYVLDDSKFNTKRVAYSSDELNDCKNIVIKIYDHANLANNQISSSLDVASGIGVTILEDTQEQIDGIHKSINSAQKNINKKQKEVEEQLKSVEKEYVAILGIFASIVFAVTGVFTFSTSVLENMQQGSMYRIIFIVLLIGFVFFNIICALFYWIDRIIKHYSNNANDLSLKFKVFSVLKNNAFVLIVNIILLISLMGIYGCWQLGIIEQRNERFENHNTIENYQELETSLC